MEWGKREVHALTIFFFSLNVRIGHWGSVWIEIQTNRVHSLVLVKNSLHSMKEMSNRNGSHSLLWILAHLSYWAVTWPHFSHEAVSFPALGGPFLVLHFYRSLLLCSHQSLDRKKTNQSPYSKFILALIPAILSVPPLSLLCITLFIFTTRSQTPQQKIT